jgi:NCAIR mutase (PurE)-related protein
MPSSDLRKLIQAIADGKTAVNDALDQLDALAVARLSEATIDLGRSARCRFGEVIYGEGKPVSLLIDISRAIQASGQQVLITRLEPSAAIEVMRHFDHHRWECGARTLRLGVSPIVTLPRVSSATTGGTSDGNSRVSAASLQGDAAVASTRSRAEAIHVAVVTAGSTDRPVASETVETLDWMGVPVDLIEDVGVAGPQRLLAVVPRLRSASVIVVIAGMEGALASMVGGYVGCPVVAVPTSVGYGANFAGLTPLLGMLISCAANVSVVGIDAGFKGGYVAGLIASQLRDLLTEPIAPH